MLLAEREHAAPALLQREYGTLPEPIRRARAILAADATPNVD